MTVNSELIRIGNPIVRAGNAKLVLPEYAMPELVNTTIPAESSLYDDSATQKYPIGAQLIMGFKGIWRYSKAGAAMAAAGFLKGNYTQCPGKAGNSAGAGFEGALYAAAVAGATSCQIADTAATKNLYQGGLLVIYNDTDSVYEQHYIVGNDASDGTSTTLYLLEGFAKAITTSYGVTVYLSQYYNIRAMSGGYMSALGWAKFSITSGYYFWLQTAGRISGVTGASTWPGQTQYYRDVYCNTDGSLIGYTAGYQRVGFLLERTASDYGDNDIMLQLDYPEG